MYPPVVIDHFSYQWIVLTESIDSTLLTQAVLKPNGECMCQRTSTPASAEQSHQGLQQPVTEASSRDTLISLLTQAQVDIYVPPKIQFVLPLYTYSNMITVSFTPCTMEVS